MIRVLLATLGALLALSLARPAQAQAQVSCFSTPFCAAANPCPAACDGIHCGQTAVDTCGNPTVCGCRQNYVGQPTTSCTPAGVCCSSTETDQQACSGTKNGVPVCGTVPDSQCAGQVHYCGTAMCAAGTVCAQYNLNGVDGPNNNTCCTPAVCPQTSDPKTCGRPIPDGCGGYVSCPCQSHSAPAVPGAMVAGLGALLAMVGLVFARKHLPRS